jgi:predicted anti-sigma-YlaC factor YlaD
MTRHLSATALACYLEGVVTRPPATRITDHLNGCPQCACVILDLAAVCAMLANVKAPPIPRVLAERLQAALVEESAQRAAKAALPHSGKVPQPQRRAGHAGPRPRFC